MHQEPPSDVYLDHAATTPVDAAVLEAMLPYFSREFANPSSAHAAGLRARRAVETAREQIAAAASVPPAEVVLTSGGSEASNLAICGLGRARKGDQVLASVVDHPASRRAAAALAELTGMPYREIPVDRSGRLDLGRLAELLTPKTALVALIHGQNETGVLQPIAAAAALLRERSPRAFLHVDAVQSFGKVDLAEVIACADSIALASHKIHGPKGVGALLLRTKTRPLPLIHGGGQEHDLRSGTENVPGIVGFGAAAARAAAALSESGPRIAAMRDAVEAAILACGGAHILGRESPRLPTIAAAAIQGVKGEVLQHHLDQAGIAIGTGSACHAGKQEISPTFAAFGLDLEGARSVIRVSLSRATRPADVERFGAALAPAVARLRALAR